MRIALVTGSSRGIGRGIAERLAADGCGVAVHYGERREAADEVVAAIRAAGGVAHAVGGDVREPQAVERIFTETERELGPVDAVVANAGVHRGGRIQSLDPADFDAVVRTSVHGTFLCFRRATEGMIERGWGRLIAIASPVGLRGSPGDAAYGAAKAGQIGMVRCVALELARTGVTANVVLPGFVETDMTGSLSERRREALVRSLPMGRPASAEEVAAAVAFLCQDDASAITGVVLPADGGISA